MSHRWRPVLCTALSLAGLGLGIGSPCLVSALATTPVGNNAIRVTPALTNISLAPNESSATTKVTLTDLTSAPTYVGLSSRDFSASESQAGAIQFYGNGYDPNTNPHALQPAISFPSPGVMLSPNQSLKVTVMLSNLTKLAPGGHYGAVLFSPEPGTGGSGKPNVSINSSVASMIFLSTASGGTVNLGLSSFSIKPLQFALPYNNYIALENSGNTQTSPVGQLTLFGPNGAVDSTTVLNPGQGLVLPGTVRLFTVQLPLVGLRFAWPGIYRMELQYRSQTDTTFKVMNKRFLYINMAVIVPVLLLLILLVFSVWRYGLAILRGFWRLFRRILRFFKKKQAPPPPQEKPKRPPRLIQG